MNALLMVLVMYYVYILFSGNGLHSKNPIFILLYTQFVKYDFCDLYSNITEIMYNQM